MYLNVGLQNGVLLRTLLDHISGDLADPRTRYLGSRPVKLFRINVIIHFIIYVVLNYTFQGFFLTTGMFQAIHCFIYKHWKDIRMQN